MGILRLTAVLGLCALAGCAVSQQQERDFNALTSSGVPTALIAKMQNYEALDLSEIETLCRKKVNETVILRYLKARRTIYSLDMKSIHQLKSAGASDALVNYLLSTPTLYARDQQQWMLNPANNPTRDPLRNNQGIPRTY